VNEPPASPTDGAAAPGSPQSASTEAVDLAGLVGALRSVGDDWRADRAARQDRTSLEQPDFDRLAAAGFLASAAPTDQGGGIGDLATATRPLAEGLRGLAGGDPSVALVAAMHPSVLGYWLATPDGGRADWAEQRRAVFASAVDGIQWGTITSEPGSGGDISRTRTVAVPADDVDPVLPGRPYRLTGQKHFGSGSGIAQFMVTTAVPEGEDAPALFVLDTRDHTWDGSSGMRLMAEWDGVGMRATQSHAMALEDAPAIRAAWDGRLDELSFAAAPFISCLFTAVVLGVVDEAVATARATISAKADQLRPFEQVEWTRAETDHWLMVQAYEGALRAVEAGVPTVALHHALRAKQAGAELAEDVLRRLGRVLGGGTFSGRSPFAHWYEDVRALGFLRPPWGFAYDSLFLTSLG
jgi:alkylation response protein AidB-like acyl-CoA dehydrogenase